MRARVLLVGAALAVAASGCGGTETKPSTAPPETARATQIDPDKDPHTLTCGDLADKVGSAAVSRRAQYALAQEARVEDMSRLRVAQSIFFAMTELCEGADESYTPAADAVRAVQQGKYIADLGAP
jgi:hypothetical protein